MVMEWVVEDSVPTDLDDPRLYINRELSWLDFNQRVLEEAEDARHPLLERVKFLAIFSSNLDEFFMIRVSGLREQLAAGVLEAPADGMTPAEQLAAIRRRLRPAVEEQMRCWDEDLRPALREAGIRVLDYEELDGGQRRRLRDYFESEIFPTLTPLAFDPGHPFPHISNLSLNLAVVVNDPVTGERFARLKVPNTLPRLLRIPAERTEAGEALGLAEAGPIDFVFIEQVMAANLDLLFPGLEVVASYPFRVTRDADVEIEEDEASDLLSAIAEGVEARQFGSVVRLQIDDHMPEHIRSILIANLELAPYQVYTAAGRMGLADLMELAGLDRAELKFPPFLPAVSPLLETDESIFSAIRRQDLLVYHPYDSFAPVVDFIRTAARDPKVLTIKQTLYRVGPNSPIVDALLEARDNDKQVAVLVELKARFDEENNIEWAKALERAGVHVVYGLVGVKVHAKLSLVVRKESSGIRRYVHMATGNYNAATARIYCDLGLFTADPDIGADVSDVFNTLTGYSRKVDYRKLLVAPAGMRRALLDKIEREVTRHKEHGDGHIAFKMNSLVDKKIIKALYRASQAGVPVDLQIRGITCLRPEVPGVSETMRVTSIVGRFLEHARIYYFRNGGDAEVYLGSADLMPRNLDGRVETLFPVEDSALKSVVIDEILQLHLSDNVQARRLTVDGSWTRVAPAAGDHIVDSQRWLLEERRPWNHD